MIVLLTLLSAAAVYATAPQTFLEVSSSDGHINGIISDHGTIAVAAEKKIFLYKDSGVPVTSAEAHIGTIELPSKIDGKGLLEFKLTQKDTVLYCDKNLCRVCALGSTCTLLFNGLNLRNAAATTDGTKIYLRIVDDKNNAAILMYNMDKNADSISPSQHTTEPDYVNETGVTESFVRGSYTYFVGSSMTPNEPLLWSKLDPTAPSIGTVRITRVCNRDSTKTIESKMEMVLSCGSMDDKKGNYRAMASHYGKNGGQVDTLLVVASAKGNSDSLTHVCRFQMTDIEQRFDQTWNTCQKVTYDARNECRDLDDDEPMPDNCYVFTWHDGSSVPCSRFSGGPSGDSNRRYENCELSAYTSSAYRFGFLTDYRPLKGEQLAVLRTNDVRDVLQVVPDVRSNTAFVANRQGGVLRIPLDGGTHSSWSVNFTDISAYRILTSDISNLFYYAMKRKIQSQIITCGDLFDSCNDLLNSNGFKDALRCGWCASPDGLGGGHVASELDKFSCPNSMVVGNCPPRIVTIHHEPTNKNWQFYGSFLNAMDDPKVLVCGEKCNVIAGTVQDNSMHCQMDNDLDENEVCDVRMEGAVNTTKLKVYFPRSMDAGTQTDQSTGTSSGMSRGVKAVIGVVATIVISILIGGICYAGRYMRKRRIKAAHFSADSSGARQRPFPGRHDERLHPEDRQTLIPSTVLEPPGLVSPKPMLPMVDNIYLPNLYEQLSRNIDPRLKIDLDDITLATEVGKGHFGIVFRGEYVNPETQHKQTVACKTLQTNVTGVREFMGEGLIMAKLDHPRVMKLIGISFDGDFRPIIITEYMANGDLVKYLRDPMKTPTLRQLLAFAIQIAEGMEYMHSQNFIHRDLAARNCMLDNQLHIRIADFGLCREVMNYESYEVLHKDRDLPLRWMPVEALESQQFTFKGDVWAYGVVLWELMTRGMMPYSNVAGYVLLQYLQAGNRLAQPTYCPVSLYDHVMFLCWESEAEKRPKFTQLIQMVKEVVHSLEQNQRTQLNAHYERVSTLRSETTPMTSLEMPSDNFDPPNSTIL